jgi:hypothetical protein
MVRNGPTKRKRGDIRVQLAVSACVLLLPPFVMAAGVMYLGASPSQGIPQSATQQAVAPDTSVTKSVSVAERSDMRPDTAMSFALASADQHPVIAEQRPAAAQSPVAARPTAAAQPTASTQSPASKQSPASTQPTAGAQPSASAQRQAAAQAVAAKDPSRYSGLAPVTLVNVEKANEQSAAADLEASPSTAKTADTPAAVPEQSPAATRIHASRRWGRHEPRAAYRVRQQPTRSLSDIFLRPTTRTRTPRG